MPAHLAFMQLVLIWEAALNWILTTLASLFCSTKNASFIDCEYILRANDEQMDLCVKLCWDFVLHFLSARCEGNSYLCVVTVLEHSHKHKSDNMFTQFVLTYIFNLCPSS